MELRPSADIVQALQTAGLLIRASTSLPELIAAITDDSRRITRGGAFIAVRGSTRDGHDFLAMAAEQGASLAIVEEDGRTTLPSLVVSDGRRGAAVAAAAFFGHPARELTMLAVTGTSGKSTTVSMLRHVLDSPTERCASIGTLGVLIGSEGTPFPGGAELTTPGAIELQRLLRALADAGVRRVAMEVSSHALDQKRVGGVEFAAGIFTNLSRDHLDYHGTMERYLEAKARLLSHLTSDGVAVVNADDAAWRALPTSPRTLRFSILDRSADVVAYNVRFGPHGSSWRLRGGGEEHAVALPLIGDFNVSNSLGSATAAWAVGQPLEEIAARLSTLPQVPGRLERLIDAPAVLRDYAHKPDALERALSAVRPFVPGRIILVFGCGGDRDRGKRPIMGEIAARLADTVILTSDNPRTEDPERILDEIEVGMRGTPHERIEDRRAAIAHAMDVARDGDLIVLAGKGHETYQIRGTTTFPFDESAIVKELAGTRGEAHPT
ncbi:MAG: UDP-N-acetylmuramoyl-L-alanyl-D-glutamate--2,6-diaminopimelate ligase [Gemmatimonadaceae bacterium]